MINRISRGLLIIGLLLLAPACGGSAYPTLQAVQTEPAESPTIPNQIPVLLPTGVPPIEIPASTSLPVLPDFEKQITFGFGAGGTIGCDEPAYEPNHIGIVITDARDLEACLYLKAFDPNQPFKIVLFQRDQKDGLKLETPNLFLSTESHQVIWQGYQDWDEFEWWEIDNQGTLVIHEFRLWLPGGFPPGAWRLSIIQSGSAFGEFWTDFQFEIPNTDPFISAFAHSPYELIPISMRVFRTRLLSLKDGERLNMTGTNYPSNRPIYVLLYHRYDIWGQAYQLELIHTQIVQSDVHGSIAAQLSATIVPGETYLIVGVSDPTIPIPKNSFSDFPFPYDFFEMAVPSSK